MINSAADVAVPALVGGVFAGSFSVGLLFAINNYGVSITIRTLEGNYTIFYPTRKSYCFIPATSSLFPRGRGLFFISSTGKTGA
jgi:hypothetical protein